MSLADELKKMEKETTNDLDSGIQARLVVFFRKHPNCSIDELAPFVNDMITNICREFANETTTKDTQTRIQELNKKIYTIRKDPQVQLLTGGNDKGKELYGKLFDFLSSEEMTGKEYTPKKDKKQVMSKEQLETRDFEIRKKYLQHIMDAYGVDIPPYMSDHMITIIEQFGIKPESMENLTFGPMSIDNAAVVKRILFDLGYQVDIDDLMRGTDVKAQKIALITEKNNGTKEMPKEDSMEYEDPCFSADEIERIQDYQETLAGVETYFREVTGLPKIKQYDEMGFEIGDEQESATPITDAMRQWGKEERQQESATPIKDAMEQWGKEEQQETKKQAVDPIIKQSAREVSKQAIRGIGIATGDTKKAIQYASAGARAGAKLGNSLEGAYSRRNTRRGQIQDASRSVRETNRNRENPEIDKGGQEYDE